MSAFLNRLEQAFSFNSSGKTGAIDAIVVQDECDCYRYSQFHVRISRFRMLYSQGKTIQVFVNNKKAKYDMKVSKDGVGYFEYSVEVEAEHTEHLQKQKTHKDKPLGMQTEKEQEEKQTNLSNIRSIKTLNRNDSFRYQRMEIGPSIEAQSLLNSKRNGNLEETSRNEMGVQLSLCAHLIRDDSSIEEIDKLFAEFIIDYETFCKDPSGVLANQKLMIKIDGQIFDSHFGLPQLMSLSAFSRDLDNKAIKKMLDQAGYNFMPSIRESTNNARQTKKKRSFKPPADFFDEIELVTGLNLLTYQFVGNFGLSFTVSSRLFFYPYQKQYRILISDIDGTITKSDVLGHVMPFIYQDWSQMGIAELYTNLSKRGYIIVYLSSRNIGLSQQTVDFLKSIKQGEFQMPEGPVILSSDDFFHAIKREMIVKNPETFKISVLRDLKQLFEHSLVNPMYAGFGNKDTDAVSYMVVGIPKKRIFTINCEGEIYVLKSDKVLSYTHLHQNINEIFPVFKGSQPPEDVPVNEVRYSNYAHRCFWSKEEFDLC